MFFISDAMAQTADAAAAGGTGGLLMQIIPIILIFVVFWFFLIRPQQKYQKKHQEMCDALKKGDDVRTRSGVLGRIVDVDEQYIVLKVCNVAGSAVTITLLRNAVDEVLPIDTLKSLDQ